MNLTFTRMGDFYEAFDDDADTVAAVLGLTRTRDRHGRRMTGIPAHRMEAWTADLERAGHTVASNLKGMDR